MEYLLDTLEDQLTFRNKLLSLGCLAFLLASLNWFLLTNFNFSAISADATEIFSDENTFAELDKTSDNYSLAQLENAYKEK